MNFTFDERQSDSPFVQTVWSTRSEQAGRFVSPAVYHWEMVIMRHQGMTTFTVRGPETLATIADCPEDAEFFGIQFKLGTFMPHLSPLQLVDNATNLPQANPHKFWLQGKAWQVPNFENSDTFIQRLVHDGLLVYDPIVQDTINGHLHGLSLRSIQRRFLRATGITHTTVYQIERARQAFELLEQGVSIMDTVYEAGYTDQPHLTRALKRFMGYTPAQVLQRVTEWQPL